MHPFPSGVPVKAHTLTLTRVLGPYRVVGFQGKLVDKFRYVFHDAEGHEYQWWTGSSLKGMGEGFTLTCSFRVKDLDADSHTNIERVRLCKTK